MVFEKINVNREGAVLFAAINAPTDESCGT
jgi:hypothetical protein